MAYIAGLVGAEAWVKLFGGCVGDHLLLGCVGFSFGISIVVGYSTSVISCLVMVAGDWELKMTR